MQKAKLTTVLAETAEVQTKPYTIWDTDIRGFGLRIFPSGRRSWVAKYRVGGGRDGVVRFPTIADAMKMSAKDARAAAKSEMASARLGQDPRGDLRAKRLEMKVAELIDLYESEGCVVQRGINIGSPMKPLTKQYTLARLRHHVVPLIGKRRVSEINPGDIESLCKAIADGKTAKDEKTGLRTRVIVKGGEGAARKVVRDLSAVFSFALRRDIAKINPVATASVRKSDNRRERYLSPDEVRRLGEALIKLEADGANWKAINIILLWALTGCRRNEIAGLKWSEVDFSNERLALEETKTGRSSRPLGDPAVSILKSLRQHAAADDVFVFPAEFGAGHYQGTKKVLAKAIALAGLPGVSPHVLRHTLGGAATSLGESIPMIGALLGHANPRSTMIYVHVANDPSRLTADRVSGGVATSLGLLSSDDEEAKSAA